jgi:hypothetical protein
MFDHKSYNRLWMRRYRAAEQEYKPQIFGRKRGTYASFPMTQEQYQAFKKRQDNKQKRLDRKHDQSIKKRARIDNKQ